MAKTDLHNHLRTSSRPLKYFNEVADAASKTLGEGGVLGVVDFCDSRYKNLINLRGYERQNLGENQNGIYIPEKDIYMIGGQEVPTKEGEKVAKELK